MNDIIYINIFAYWNLLIINKIIIHNKKKKQIVKFQFPNMEKNRE